MRADRRLCLDKYGRLAEAGSLESAMLLAHTGQEIEPEDVKRLDLRVWSDGRVMQGPEPMPEPAPVVAPVPVVEPEPAMDAPVAPLEGIVHPAGAMPEPAPKQRGKKKSEA